MTNAHSTRILIEDERAVGVEYVRHGETMQVNAAREVIVSAGAINSPQLLQLSGVGPANLLKQNGIEVVTNLPSVGQHLQDHLCITNIYRSKVPTLNDQLRPMWGKVLHGMNYLLRRRGPLALGVNQGGGFFQTRSGLDRPNMQLYFSPVSYTKSPPGERLC